MMRVLPLMYVAVLIVAVDCRCCAPDVFQSSFVGLYTASNRRTTEMKTFQVDIWFDFESRKMAAETSLYDGKRNYHKVIDDYSKRMRYEISNNGQHEICKAYKDTSRMEHMCLPEGSKFTGSATFGIGNTTIGADFYTFVNERARVTFYFTVSHDECAFLQQFEYNVEDRTSAMAGGTFFDYLPRIVNPGVFVPPANCTPGIPVEDSVQENTGLHLLQKALRNQD